MFFSNSVQELGTIPEYFLADVLRYENELTFSTDLRHLLGKNSVVQAYYASTNNIKNSVTSISNYLYSQQYACLKNMVALETSVVALSNYQEVYEIKQPTRYVCRVGEQIVIPLKSEATITSHTFNEITKLSCGNVYRLNNRTDLSLHASEDFVAIVYNFVDFDIKKYLMTHDLNSIFPIQKDEVVVGVEFNPPEEPVNQY